MLYFSSKEVQTFYREKKMVQQSKMKTLVNEGMFLSKALETSNAAKLELGILSK